MDRQLLSEYPVSDVFKSHVTISSRVHYGPIFFKIEHLLGGITLVGGSAVIGLPF